MENTEQGTPQELTPVEQAVVPDVAQLTQELDRKEAEIKRLQGISRDLQKRGVPKEELDALKREISDTQMLVAEGLDDLRRQMSGEEAEKPTRKSYKQIVEERRSATPKSEVDPDAAKFFNYMVSQGLSMEDAIVQESIAGREPSEALKHLKEKMDTQTQAQLEKMAEDKAKTYVERTLKEMGLTAGGAGGPNAASGRSFTEKQIWNMPIEEYKANKEAIAEAQRMGRIK